MTGWRLVFVLVTVALIAVAATTITQDANAVVDTMDFRDPEPREKAIDDCMISLKAQNPREQHLLDCDVLMPLVPRLIQNELIENTTETNKNFEEYMTQRVLEVPTEAEIKEQAMAGQIIVTPIMATSLFDNNDTNDEYNTNHTGYEEEEEQAPAAVPTPEEQEEIDVNVTRNILDILK